MGEGGHMRFDILQIDHVVFRVADAERAIRFYREVLGCTLERTVEAFGLVQLRAGAALIDLVTIDGAIGRKGGAAPGRTGRNVDHLALRIAPFDATVLFEHLERHGVSHGDVTTRYGAEGFGPSIYIEDPDGNVIELKGPAEEGLREDRPGD